MDDVSNIGVELIELAGDVPQSSGAFLKAQKLKQKCATIDANQQKKRSAVKKP